MLSSFTTKLALKKAGIPSDILSFPTEKREPNKLRKNPPNPSDSDADSSWSSWMSVRSLPLTVQPWLTPPPAAVSVGRVPGIGDKAPVDKTQKLRLGRRTLVVFLRCVGCASVSHASEQATKKWVDLLGGAWSVRVIVDEDRALYAAWGLGTSSMWYVLNPSTQVQSWKETGWLGEKVAGAIQGKTTPKPKPKTTVQAVGNEEEEEDEGPLTTMGNKWQEAGAFAVDGTGTVIWGGKAARADDVMELEDGARILLA
ncbi:unnamed protein product [Fusarium graminearum]|uniref:Chromosome 1, complete genome n=1 Tax=Gibberella zeae (strain ATCC MYA-4620 / CBS 123657 / FGSC 9075 / NRRL 31084 / PH-1) TaxID=229533 RepID=A0A1C3YHD9_GIBZE|nr:unnamed protein product [Fusarium graminearum]CAF3601018.1 unnamed protein product [Fusarium graminearum]SCB64014.1 unnamed protein product [Fusarium graminearum]